MKNPNIKKKKLDLLNHGCMTSVYLHILATAPNPNWGSYNTAKSYN